MAKLFAGKEFNTDTVTPQTIDAKLENSDIPNISEEYDEHIQVAVEGFRRASNELYIVEDIQASLESKKLSSVEYFTSVENYSLFMKSIANNLGVKAKIPSMEDFKNPYGIESSHKFMMEGFKEFIRDIWEKIKSFFKDFFKKIMLFLKRLVNANLEMEEYEQYIEDLMHKVRTSDKSKVDPVKVDSKLPMFLSDFGSSEMNVDYLLTKGRQKLSNLVGLSDVMIEKAIPGLVSNVGNVTNDIKNNFKKGYNPLPSHIKEFTSLQRDRYLASLRNIFTFGTNIKSLPEDVHRDVLSIFDSNQLEEQNTEFLSLIEDRNKMASLPNGYNMFLTISNYDVTNGNETNRTAKIFISPSFEKNTHAQNSMYTITDKNNLLKFYDFYKTFSKGVKINRIEDRLEKMHDVVHKMINDLENPFKFALEAINVSGDDDDDQPRRGVIFTGGTSMIEEFEREQREQREQMSRQASQQPELSEQEGQLREQTKNEIKEFQKFVFGYMNSLQVFIKEFSVNVVGSYQECRYEMIKYLYKSAKEF